MKRTGFLMLMWFGMHAAAQEPKTFSLQQCVDAALQRNGAVRQAALRAQAAGVNHDQAKYNRLPSANADIFHGANSGRSIDPFTNGYVNQQVNYAGYGIGSNVTLFSGSSLKNLQRGAGLAFEAAQLETEGEKANLTLQVILAYLQVLNNEDLVAQAQTNALVTQKQVERLDLLNRQGAIAPPLLQELLGQLQNEKVRIIEAENSFALSRLALARLMNMEYDPALRLERLPFVMPAPAGEQQLPVSEDNAVAQWPLVQALALRQKSAARLVQAEKGRMYPSLFFGGGINSNYSSAARREVLVNTTDKASGNYVVLNGDKLPVFVPQSQYSSQAIGYSSQLRNNVYSNVELGLRLPLFNGLQVRNRIRLAKIEVQNWALQEEQARIQLRNDVEGAAIQLQAARERVRTLQEGVTAFGEAFRAAEIRFNAGVGTVVDYLIAKNNLDQARANLTRGQYDYVLRQKLLDYYLNRRLL